MRLVYPQGDPAGMRAAAAVLRAEADALDALGRRLEARMHAMHFESPAACRIRRHMSEVARSWHFDASAIRDVAAMLDQGAGRVDALRREYARAEREEREKAARGGAQR